MVSVAKVIKTVGSKEAKEIASKAVELLKAKGTKKLKKAEDLVKEEKKTEEGGLSGRPLRDLSTNLIRRFYRDLKGKIPDASSIVNL